MVSAEQLRLDEAGTDGIPWRRWGPYLSERQRGTLREDYGSGDNTWSYFSHEQVSDPHWRDLVLFYEYFHGDNGAGIGASHRSGWTGTVALGLLLFGGISAGALRTGGRGAIMRAAAGGPTGAAR